MLSQGARFVSQCPVSPGPDKYGFCRNLYSCMCTLHMERKRDRETEQRDRENEEGEVRELLLKPEARLRKCTGSCRLLTKMEMGGPVTERRNTALLIIIVISVQVKQRGQSPVVGNLGEN